MLTPPLLNGLEAMVVETPRLRTHVIARGPLDGEPVILIHGNLSAARFFEELMVAMPARYRVLAPDLRGYGRSETKSLDATRGARDFSDDIYALTQTLGLRKPHLLGWSLGGNVAMQYTIDHPADVTSLTFIATGSPYSFGGSHGPDGTSNNPEFSGSGGGIVNREFLGLIMAGERGSENPNAPRNVMNRFYYKPPFQSPREEIFLSELLLTACGEGNYPGDFVAVEAWPGVGPGTRGLGNVLSPKYLQQGAFADINPRPPVLWVRGDSDQIVSDMSAFDFGVLGQMGIVPGWPGADVYPPQPMVSQTRALLDKYVANGGSYREVVLENCGHSPHIEKPEAFNTEFFAFLESVQR